MSAAAAGWAAGLAAASVVLGGGGGRVLLGRVRQRGGGRGRPAWRPRPRRVGWAAAGVVVVAAAAVGRPLLGGAAALVVACIARERRGAARVRAAAVEERRVREFAVLAAAELRAGRPARAAVGRAARAVALLPPPAGGPAGRSVAGWARASTRGSAGGPAVERARGSAAGPARGTAPGGPPVTAGSWAEPLAAAAEWGDDVGDALEAGAEQPGAGVLRDLAACWRVAEGTGAGLAAALDVVAAGLRDREAQRRELAAQLAGVRATGWLLAALPAFGLVLGGALGAQPWRVLLDTGAGNATLAAGLALDVAGLAWLGRLVRGVQR